MATQTTTNAKTTTTGKTIVAPGNAAGPDPLEVAVTTQKVKAPKMGVNPNARTRAAAAGEVIAHRGHANGITPEMVVECGKLYGSPNKVEDEICLRNAWHAIRAFCQGYANAYDGAKMPKR